MKSITEYTTEEHKKRLAEWRTLHNLIKSYSNSELFDDYSTTAGYAHFTFRGTVSQKLIDIIGRVPTE